MRLDLGGACWYWCHRPMRLDLGGACWYWCHRPMRLDLGRACWYWLDVSVLSEPTVKLMELTWMYL